MLKKNKKEHVSHKYLTFKSWIAVMFPSFGVGLLISNCFFVEKNRLCLTIDLLAVKRTIF